MAETKDYNKYTYEKNSRLEMGTKTHNDIVQTLVHLSGKYEQDFPNKDRSILHCIIAFVQKKELGEDKVEVAFESFDFAKTSLRALLDKEIILSAPFRFDNVNNKTSKVVKSIPKGKSQEYSSVFNPIITAEEKLDQRLSANGQTILRIVNALDQIHVANVDAGKAITFEDLAKKNAAPIPQENATE